jgi:hypothetical protein
MNAARKCVWKNFIYQSWTKLKPNTTQQTKPNTTQQTKPYPALVTQLLDLTEPKSVKPKFVNVHLTLIKFYQNLQTKLIHKIDPPDVGFGCGSCKMTVTWKEKLLNPY